MASLFDTPGASPAVPASPIVEATVQNFMREVIEASLQLPVLVYFTAPWCGPCKQFGPTLEKVAKDSNGRLKLVKVDVDKNPQLAQQFRIQSVPMVYIFMNGQPVDGFSGAMQEGQLKQLLSQFLAATPEEEDAKAMLDEAVKLLEADEAEQAAHYFEAVLRQDRDNVDAKAGLASASVLLGKLQEAENMLSSIPEAMMNHEAVASARARLQMAKSVPKSDLPALQARIASDPGDKEGRYALANALYASGEVEEAINQLLALIAADKDWNEGAARQQLLTIFDAIGFSNPLAQQGRRKLSSILFR